MNINVLKLITACFTLVYFAFPNMGKAQRKTQNDTSYVNMDTTVVKKTPSEKDEFA